MCVCVCVYRSVQVHVRSSAVFTREVDGDIHHVVGHFHTKPQLVNSSVDVDVDCLLTSLNEKVENFNERGSGFVIEQVSQFVLVITKYRPLHGPGRSFVPTPEHLKRRECIVNVENNDQNVSYGQFYLVSTSHQITNIVLSTTSPTKSHSMSKESTFQ